MTSSPVLDMDGKPYEVGATLLKATRQSVNAGPVKIERVQVLGFTPKGLPRISSPAGGAVIRRPEFHLIERPPAGD